MKHTSCFISSNVVCHDRRFFCPDFRFESPGKNMLHNFSRLQKCLQFSWRRIGEAQQFCPHFFNNHTLHQSSLPVAYNQNLLRTSLSCHFASLFQFCASTIFNNNKIATYPLTYCGLQMKSYPSGVLIVFCGVLSRLE